jgi:hypothetical protein
MSSSCCGGASKAPAKAATVSALQTNQPTADLLTAEPTKSECCKDTPSKSVKKSCGC